MAPRRDVLTRQGIIDTTREMLRTTDLEDLSLRKLASELGVTAPALYAHVEDKDDLMRAVAEIGFNDLVARMTAVDDPDPLVRLRGYGRAYVELALSDPEVFRVMFRYRPEAIDVPDVDNTLSAATDAFALPGLAVADAIERGAIHPGHDPLRVAMTLWATNHGCATVLLLGAQGGKVVIPPEFTNLVDDVISATLAGLAAPPSDHSADQSSDA
jgi:AcrR family transcriptional regulator